MITLIIQVLILLLVAGVLWWAVGALVHAFSIPQPFATVILVVVMLLLLLAFLDIVGVFAGHMAIGHT